MNENIVCTFIDAHFAELVLREIDEVEYPRLMCDGEKEAVRKGLMLLLDRQSANECEYWDNESSFCALQRPADHIKHGRWIKMSDANGVYWACSECGESIPRISHFDPQFDLFPRLESVDKTNYCPHCGAKME